MFSIKMYKPVQYMFDKGAALVKAAYERFAPYSDRNTHSVLIFGDGCDECKETVIIRNPTLAKIAFLRASEHHMKGAEEVTPKNFRRLFTPAPEQMELDLGHRTQ